MAINDFLIPSLVGLIVILVCYIIIHSMYSKKKKKPKVKEVKKEPEKPILDPKLTKTLESGKFYYESEPYYYFKHVKGRWRRWRDLRKARKNPHLAVRISMELNNGRHREFLAIEDEKRGFIYNKGRYVFDPDKKYYIVDSNIWGYDYHEELPVPIKKDVVLSDEIKDQIIKINDSIRDNSKKPVKRTYNIELIKELLSQSMLTDIKDAFNPQVLQRYLKSNFIEGLINSGNLPKLIRVFLVIMIIVAFLSLLTFGIMLYDSGLITKAVEAVRK